MKRNILAAVSAFVLAAAAAGCGSSPQEGNTEGASVESTSEGAEISGASGEVSGSSGEEQGETAGEETRYPLTITDDLGNSVTIESQPERVVSLSPANTETLFALGGG